VRKLENRTAGREKYSMTGKRDPFLSPVVNRQDELGLQHGQEVPGYRTDRTARSCEVGQRLIAVVTNALNQGVFPAGKRSGVQRVRSEITVDSIVFKQNFQDRLGKPFTKML